ncbi:MAG: hypothetical protein K0U86_02990 [Planctomycetes bacterium]|nr:hypothetical protein [Planctomycetota bacterium]MCH9723856.1 hypothetical protein [Planctomycetota bacterium]MCH9778055.1 hypothetical protein [Planctomycetota bacterium]MCH9790477.1 hypothetical protein [Planctomycetota bacterium]MDF1742810.1 hypothetical protein [Gimesia sp.]
MNSSMLLLGVLASLPGFVCFLFFVLPLSLLIGSVVLIAAIYLVNKITGNDKKRSNSIPLPTVVEGMGIVLVATLINMAISYLLGFFLGVEGVQPGMDRVAFEQAIKDAIEFELMVFLSTILVNCTVFALMLPTSFVRAMVVVFFQILIVLLNVIIIALVVIGIMFAVNPI